MPTLPSTRHATGSDARAALLARFDTTRHVSRILFDLIADEAYYQRPITLRNPIVFYEGHISAFAVNALLKSALGAPGIDAELERIFARGIDPEDEAAIGAESVWPSRDRVRAYVAEADRRLRDVLEREELERPGHPLLDRAEAVYAVIEHEEMHQETLQYIWHRLPFEQKRVPSSWQPIVDGRVPPRRRIHVPAGSATLGVARSDVPFAWDNEMPPLLVQVPAFEIDEHDVTNAEFFEFVEAGGYWREDLWTPEAWAWRRQDHIEQPLFWERHEREWYWRGMFGLVPLPPAWPVYVSHAEASAFLRWRGDRLPSEAEYHRAAFGAPGGGERDLPWGSAPPGPSHGNFGNRRFDPVSVGRHPAGVSAWGVHDLIGNGWEWTSTPFRPFPGFQPLASYPEYSADFFDDKHFVLKGASPATPSPMIRRSFRNWFRPHYPYVYATFRGVRA
jgi:gamma-glutamyl hercynylcysteine S-oxide synthase